MMSRSLMDHSCIVCLEGPSAVGKTTLAAALARECGAAVIPELDGSEIPAITESATWFMDRHAALWQQARVRASSSSFVVLDGDPFKGLWYNLVYSADSWPRLETVAPLYQSHLERGTIAIPVLYVVLTLGKGSGSRSARHNKTPPNRMVILFQRRPASRGKKGRKICDASIV